jgi:hypothetical protein
LLLLASTTFSTVLDITSGQAILTLLMVPLYFMLDWLLRLILDASFGIVEQPHEKTVPAEAAFDEAEGKVELEAAEQTADGTSRDKPAAGGHLDLDRMKGPLGTALRLTLAVLLFFWVLNTCGLSLLIGEAVVKTLIKILVVVLVYYVAWGIVNAAIMQRMRREMLEEARKKQQRAVQAARASRPCFCFCANSCW